jgi:hypothetical protein
MTDNEKRAHDLTLLYLQEIFRIKFIAADRSGETVPLEFIDSYAELYPKILEKINEKF